MKWSLPAADTYFAPHLTEQGFQIDHLYCALKHVTSWRTAVDGGAHVGTWTVEMARHFKQVMAFEPAPDTYACLVENTSNWLNVERLRAALGAEHSYGVIADDPARPGNTGARFLKTYGHGDVVVHALDEYGIEDLDFLKLDLEGSELTALRGATQTIKRCRPIVVMEVKNLGRGDPEEAVGYLVGMGYREVERTRNDRVYLPV